MKIGYWIIGLLLTLFILAVPVTGLAQYDNKVLKPDMMQGEYGNGTGQIYRPISVATDKDCNIYVLHDSYIDINDSSRHKRVVSIYDKYGNHLITFDVVKRTTKELNPAPLGDLISSNYYYDVTASELYVGEDGKIYVLSAYDVLIFDEKGKYRSQFTVWPNANWIYRYKDTSYHYPKGIYVDNMTRIYTSTGSLPSEHAILVYSYDGRLLNKMNTPTNGLTDLFADKDGTIHLLEEDSKTITLYDRYLNKIDTIKLDYKGEDKITSITMMPDGKFVASANGVFVFGENGRYVNHFKDYDAAKKMNCTRPVATDIEKRIITISGQEDSDKTARPILIYLTERNGANPTAGTGYDPNNTPAPTYNGNIELTPDYEGGWIKAYRKDYQPVACCVPYAPLYLIFQGFNLIAGSIP
ncbi:hypothetical protein CUJ83_02465 [Methanocella sp. CWC-04]|uniref:Uncharacterized protein n=1 Tax=Methanooceanicella nereidis TaxID=2052831 RepID=A0AAP2W699_9EURY|nr:hypothetical protein [Methanocella sp. CWC-04]MCD1293861.1 hypothetical protein [Methanocella sp. CWC-04]